MHAALFALFPNPRAAEAGLNNRCPLINIAAATATTLLLFINSKYCTVLSSRSSRERRRRSAAETKDPDMVTTGVYVKCTLERD